MKPIYELPNLHTERLVLRPFVITDVKRVTELLHNKLVSDTALYIPHPYTEKDAIDWISSQVVDFQEERNTNFAVTLKSDNELIGAIGLKFNKDFDNAELGYWIGVDYWNMGYATEAAKRTVKFGFEVLDFNRIFAHYMGNNPASGQVMEKAGMKYEGILRKHVCKNGTFHDLIVYGILKEDYLHNRF